jgi:integrase
VATLYLRGDCWYLNWRADGRQRRQSLGKIERQAAEAIRREKEAQLTLGIQPAPRSPTLAEWIDDYCTVLEAEGKSKKRRNELAHARRALGHLHIASLPALLVEDFKVARLRAAKPETVGKEIRMLKAALNKAVELDVIKANPIAKFKPPRGVMSQAVPYYTKKQLAAIYKADRALAPLWRFMVNTGIRRGEFAKARRADIAHGALKIESTDAARTKSGRWRPVPLNTQAKDALKRLGDDRLSPYAADTLSHKFLAVARAAGVGGNLHMLRHTFCSHLVMAGVSLREVQVLAGHSTFSITEQYAHVAKENKTAAVNKVRL